MTSEEIKKYKEGYFKFTYPRHWGVNESVITEIFGFNKKLNESQIKKRIKKFVICYMETNGFVTPSKDKFDKVDWNDERDRVFHDMQTEIGNMICLTFMTFCQCWSKSSNIKSELPSLEQETKVICKNFDLSIDHIVLNVDGKTAYLRAKAVTYSQFTYGSFIEKTIIRFCSDRKLTRLLDLVKKTHENQQEVRFFVTFEPLHYINWSYSMGYMVQRYSDVDMIGDIDDLVESLYIQATHAKLWYEKYFNVKDDSIYIKIENYFNSNNRQ